jgi:hypothetical protein
MRVPSLSPLLPAPSERPRILFALGLAVIGGSLATLVGLPLPWMLGPMIVTAVAALAGAPVAGPRTLRPVVIPVLGVMLGAGFSPEIIAQLGSWAGTFALLPAFLGIGGGIGWVFYRYVAGYDMRTAFFCAAPGGLNEMILMSEASGADDRRVALAHAVRIFTVIIVIALGFALIEGTTSAGLDSAHTGFREIGLRQGLLLLLCALLGVPLATLLRLPAAGLVGPMILSAALHLAGVATAAPPTLLVLAAQLVVGTILGCRFVGASLRETGRDIALGIAASFALLVVTLGFAALAALLTSAPWSQAVLAYAPGGLAEMSLLALAKNQDVAYVATAHITRIVIIIFTVPLLFRALEGRLPGPGARPR